MGDAAVAFRDEGRPRIVSVVARTVFLDLAAEDSAAGVLRAEWVFASAGFLAGADAVPFAFVFSFFFVTALIKVCLRFLYNDASRGTAVCKVATGARESSKEKQKFHKNFEFLIVGSTALPTTPMYAGPTQEE